MAFWEKMELIPFPNVRIVGHEVTCSLDPIRKNSVPAL